MEKLIELQPGTPVVFGGNRVTTIPDELAAAFVAGDRLVIVQDTGALLHIPADVWDLATGAVDRAAFAFSAMGGVTDDQITGFYHAFADRLADDALFAPIAQANAQDVERARAWVVL